MHSRCKERLWGVRRLLSQCARADQLLALQAKLRAATCERGRRSVRRRASSREAAGAWLTHLDMPDEKNLAVRDDERPHGACAPEADRRILALECL